MRAGSSLGQTVFKGIFGEAADAVTAHFSLGAVSIEHSHAHIGGLRGHNKYQAVSTDTEVAITDDFSQFRRFFNLLLEAVDIYIIVTDTVHFSKAHDHILNINHKTDYRPERDKSSLISICYEKTATLPVTPDCVQNKLGVSPKSAEYIIMIFAVDAFLDMFRTSTNVLGDSVGAIVINRLEKFSNQLKTK